MADALSLNVRRALVEPTVVEIHRQQLLDETLVGGIVRREELLALVARDDCRSKVDGRSPAQTEVSRLIGVQGDQRGDAADQFRIRGIIYKGLVEGLPYMPEETWVALAEKLRDLGVGLAGYTKGGVYHCHRNARLHAFRGQEARIAANIYDAFSTL